MYMQKLPVLSADKYWFLEHGLFVETAGAKGDQRYVKKVLDCFPGASGGGRFKSTCVRLRSLQASPVGDLFEHGLKSQLETICGWLNIGIRRVVIKKGLLHDAKARMANFLEFSVDPGASGGVLLAGKAAVTAMLADLQRRSDAEEHIELSELQPLIMFTYLLSAGERQKVSDWARR